MRTVALATLAYLAVALCAGSPAEADIPWQQNLRAAHTQAEAEGKLLLLHFYTDNCVYCDRLEEGAFQEAQVGEAISRNFVPVKIHAKSAPDLVKLFKVTKFPTDVVVTTERKKLLHQVSPQNPTKYVAMLVGTLAASEPNTKMIAAVTPEMVAPKMSVPKMVAQETIASVPPAPIASPSIASTEPAWTLPRSVSDLTPPVSAPDLALPRSVEATTVSATTKSAAPQVTAMGSEAELAMEGFCAVTVIAEDRWVEGKPEHGVIHLGKLYLFQNEELMNQFLADPIPYTPVLNEIDVVRFFEERKIVPGKREWGVTDPNYRRMFFFADEAAMDHFIDQHQRYTDAAIEVMQTAVKDANPDS